MTEIHRVEVRMDRIRKVVYHLVGSPCYFIRFFEIFRTIDPFLSLSIVFEHQLENEILPYSQTLAARKIAISSFEFSSHPSSPPLPATATTTKQASLDSTSQFYLPTENKSPRSPLHKFFWNKSISKEG